jgi:hypothetical protein
MPPLLTLDHRPSRESQRILKHPFDIETRRALHADERALSKVEKSIKRMAHDL